MDKLTSIYICRYFIYLFSFFLMSCSYHQGVYLKNDTKNNLMINVQFETKKGRNSLDFALKADGYDAWEYEAGYFEKKQIDKSLMKITIKSESGCEKIYSREEISKIAVKRGMWEILIDKRLIDCE